MSDMVPSVPGELRDLVRGIGSEVTQEDIDAYGALLSVQGRADAAKTVLGAWEEQQNEERKMREGYLRYLKWAFGAQAALVNAAFFLLGLGYIEVAEWVASSFILGVFGELSAMTLLVLRYLFPQADPLPGELAKLGRVFNEQDRSKAID